MSSSSEFPAEAGAVLPMMLAAGGGSIVNVSSGASLRASASGVAYTASKHAVNGITKSTRLVGHLTTRSQPAVGG